MKPLIKKYLGLGAVLFLCGAVLVTRGTLGIKRFFEEDSGVNGYSVAAVTRGLVLPHVSTLVGVAGVTFGLILLVKGMVFVTHGKR